MFSEKNIVTLIKTLSKAALKISEHILADVIVFKVVLSRFQFRYLILFCVLDRNKSNFCDFLFATLANMYKNTFISPLVDSVFRKGRKCCDPTSGTFLPSRDLSNIAMRFPVQVPQLVINTDKRRDRSTNKVSPCTIKC